MRGLVCLDVACKGAVKSGKDHSQQTPEKDYCATHVAARGLRIKIPALLGLRPLSGQFNAAMVVPFSGCSPRGKHRSRACRDATHLCEKICPKSSPAYHVHRPRARCVSPAAGVMIRLGGEQTWHFELSVCARRPLIEEGSTRWALFPECWDQAKESRLNHPGQTSPARASRSGQPGAESYHRFGVYFGIFEHAGCNPEPRRQALTGFG